MTSQLNVDTIVDKAGSGGTNITVGNNATYVAEGGSANSNNLVQGLVKQWQYWDHNPGVTLDSFNSASVTDNGTGDYTYNFTNNMNNNDYAVSSIAAYAQLAACDFPEHATDSYNIRIFSRADSLTNDDTDQTSMAVGDLA